MFVPLNSLGVGQCATVTAMAPAAGMRRRLQDIGLIEGTRVQCVLKSPAGDPAAYRIRGAVIALRGTDAAQIFVTKGEAVWG